MSSTAFRLPPDIEARRGHILDAAGRCFTRGGFHRTTMQDVAAEAGMSPGNIYRYFPSKDAIVAGLAERDRAGIAEDFSKLGREPDILEAFSALARQHLTQCPAENAVLALEIWAEATRNPAVAATMQAFDAEILECFTGMFRAIEPPGRPGLDATLLGVLVAAFGNGLMVRRSMNPDADLGPAVEGLLAIIRAVLAGTVELGARPAAQRPHAAPVSGNQS